MRTARLMGRGELEGRTGEPGYLQEDAAGIGRYETANRGCYWPRFHCVARRWIWPR